MRDERHPQLAALDEMVQQVQETNAFQRARLLGARVRTLDDVRALPLTTKHELLLDQAAAPPYGELPAIGADGAVVARAVGESLPESYYFTVAFLDTIGFFD